MSIYKRKSGRYTVVLAQSEGSSKRRSLGTFATRKEAEDTERRALVKRSDGIDLAPQTTTLAEVFASFIAEAEADGLSGTTLRNYRETFADARASPRFAYLNSSRLTLRACAQLFSKKAGATGEGRCRRAR